jgi:hypothetical protein
MHFQCAAFYTTFGKTVFIDQEGQKMRKQISSTTVGDLGIATEDSPLYELVLPDALVFSSFERTAALLRFFAAEAEIGERVLECHDGVWALRQMYDEEQELILKSSSTVH